MSAIAGIVFHQSHSPDEVSALVGRMLDAMPQRGPDGRNLQADERAGIGHLLLHTTPESLHERLPLQRGNRLLTSDARLDNREALLSALGDEGRPPDEITDAELILWAYEKWDAACCEHLLGDFAFAIWDAEAGTLFCGRDHFGVKPFYYYAAPEFFAFATEIKALLALPGVPQQLDETAIGDLLAAIGDDVADTFYVGIRRLLPAHGLTLRADAPHGAVSHEPQLQRYWRLDPSRELRLASDEEYAQRFRELFLQAVKCRMRSAFPVGANLSGGLDSSSIAVAARHVLREEAAQQSTPVTPLPTFSAVFDILKQCDERDYIDLTLGQGDLEPHYFKAEEVSPLVDLEPMLERADAPVDAGNNHIVWCIEEMARAQGIRVLLDGYDGDTCVSHGTALFYELALSNRWGRLARELKGYTRRVTGQNWRLAWWHWFNLFFLMPRLGKIAPARYAIRIAHRIGRAIKRKPASSPSTPITDEMLVNPEFGKRVGLQQRRRASQQRWGAPRTEREDHFRKLEWGITPGVLEWKNHTAATFGGEVWFPFWDVRLVEFCLSLPPEQKLRDGYIRWVMRRAMEGLLPEKVAWRSDKSNLYPGFERGIKLYEGERLKKMVENPGNVAPFVNVDAMREAYRRFTEDKATPAELTLLCRIAVIDAWITGHGSDGTHRKPQEVTT